MPLPPDHPHQQLPGCGLAAYAGLLMLIASAGAVMMGFSYYSLIASGNDLSPMRTAYGGLVDARVLQPMRDAGLLGPEELPDAFHAEAYDGSAACAISQDVLLRLSDQGAQRLPLAELEGATGDETEVIAVGAGVTIRCAFRPGEGAGSFKVMVESVRRAER